MSLLVVRAFPYWAEGSQHTAEGSRRRAALFHSLAAKRSPSIRVRLLKVKRCVTADHLFFVLVYPGPCPALVAPLLCPWWAACLVLVRPCVKQIQPAGLEEN